MATAYFYSVAARLEITSDLIDAIKGAIDQGSESMIVSLLGDAHATDIAEIIPFLSTEQGRLFLEFLDEEIATDAISHLEEDVREDILETFTPQEIAEEFIERMDSDDAADLIGELPDDRRSEVISHIEDVEQASDIVDLLKYPEDSAGGLMAKELIKVNINWDVIRCVREMRKQAQDLENVYTVYVVDDNEILQGTLSLKRLLLAPATAHVEDLYKSEVISVSAEEEDEAVAKVMEKYDLVALPVVDSLNRLIGRITIDDVVDVIREEAEKDYQLASGLSDNVEESDSMWEVTKARLPWLLVGMLGGILSAQVIGIFDIEANPQIAIFIPLIAAMGGNVGVQSSAIVVQSLAQQNTITNVYERLVKEFGTALLNGIICSVLLFGFNFMIIDSIGLSIAVSLSLLSVIIFAALFGTFIPLALNKYKIDPALATGPFITTANDIFGLFLYFLIAQMILQ